MADRFMITKLTDVEASPFEISIVAQLEEVLHKWKHSDQQHFESPTWNKSDAKLLFDSCEFIMTRYWVSGISEERDVSDTKDQGDNTKETVEMSKAWLERRNKSEMFPWDDNHYIHSYYGLEDFIVIYYPIEAAWDIKVDKFLNILLSAVNKTECRIPLFGLFHHTIESYSYKMINPRLIEGDLEPRKDLSVAKVSMWSSCVFSESANQLLNVDSTTDFKIEDCSYNSDNDWNPPINTFDLCAYWLDLPESEAIDDKRVKILDHHKAHKWSVKIDLADAAGVLLGDCLKMFLRLFSTQTESLFKHPQIASMLKYRRIYKQRKEVNAVQGFRPKVTSKLTLKSEESLIPVDSLNAILDFLFCDENLKTPQHSNGGNPSTTTAEDEVEDKFFLSYKELKYFKSAQPSITCRLAICLCIVNKYHGGIGAVNQLWAEFVMEMKYRLENNCEINGLEHIDPNFDYGELLNKLQVLNNCIEKRKSRDAPSAITSNPLESITENSGKEFIDISELPADEESIDQSESSVSASTNRALMRVQKLFDPLVAMKTFKLANPGCTIGDFVRWCSTEDWKEEMVTEGKDKATNEVYLNKWIKVSENVSIVFHNDPILRRYPDDDDAEKVLHWLASMKPSDLVFGLMPVLINSVVTKLLKHPSYKQHQNFFQDHLIKIKDNVPRCNSQNWLEKMEDVIDHLALIAENMTEAQYLLKKFRYYDPTMSVSDQELEGFVFELVEFSNASIPTPNAELPSHTNLGKIIYEFFCTGRKVTGLPFGTDKIHNVCQFDYSGIPYHTCYSSNVCITSFDDHEFRIVGSNTCAVSNKETAS